MLRPTAEDVATARNIRPELTVEGWDFDGDVGSSLDVQDDFERASSLPRVLEGSPHLSYLSIPTRLAKALRSHHLANLRGVLRFHGDGTADLRALLAPVPVTDLVGYKVAFKLHPACFPDLAHLDIRVTKSMDVNRYIRAFPKIASVLLMPATDAQVSRISDRLDAIGMFNGHLTSLECVEHLQALRFVSLNNLPKLTSIDSLVRLPRLVEVAMGYCPNVDVSALLKCERLTFVSAIAVPQVQAIAQPLRDLMARRGGEASI